MTTYWLISAPSNNGEMFKSLSSNIGSLSELFPLTLPKLRSGTLDSLMTLSDDLSKHDSHVDGVLRKIEKQMNELQVKDFTVKSTGGGLVSMDEVLTQFKWASNKYQEKLSLAEIVGKIHADVSRYDEDLRGKQTEYNTLKSQKTSYERKKAGNLAVRSLTSLGAWSQIKAQLVNTENFVTVFVVMQKTDEKTWEQTYETGLLGMEENLGFSPVILGSSREVYAEEGEIIFSVTLFRRKFQDFKNAVREKHPRWTVREYKPETEQEEQLEQENAGKMDLDVDKAEKSLKTWCKSMHGELFGAYVHLKAIRLFVESCLRYGVPPDFQPVVIRLNDTSNERKVRKQLQGQFGRLGNEAMFVSGDDAAMAMLSGSSQEFFPYVFLTATVSTPVAAE